MVKEMEKSIIWNGVKITVKLNDLFVEGFRVLISIPQEQTDLVLENLVHPTYRNTKSQEIIKGAGSNWPWKWLNANMELFDDKMQDHKFALAAYLAPHHSKCLVGTVKDPYTGEILNEVME